MAKNRKIKENRYSKLMFEATDAFMQLSDFSEIKNVTLNDVVKLYNGLPRKFLTKENIKFANAHLANSLYCDEKGNFDFFLLLERFKNFDSAGALDNTKKALEISYYLITSSRFRKFVADWEKFPAGSSERVKLIEQDFVYEVLPLLDPFFISKPMYFRLLNEDTNYLALSIYARLTKKSGKKNIIAFNEKLFAASDDAQAVMVAFVHERLHADQIERAIRKDALWKLAKKTHVDSRDTFFTPAYFGNLREVYAYALQCSIVLMMRDFYDKPQELVNLIKQKEELSFVLQNEKDRER